MVKNQYVSQIISETHKFIDNLPRLHNPLFKKLKKRLIRKLELLSNNQKFLMESSYYLKKISYKPKLIELEPQPQPKLNLAKVDSIITPAVIVNDIFIDIPYWNVESLSYDDIISSNLMNSDYSNTSNTSNEVYKRFKIKQVFLTIDKCDVLLSRISDPDEYLFQKYYSESKKIFQRMTTFITTNQFSVDDANNYRKMLNGRYITAIYVLHQQQNSYELGYSKVEIKLDDYTNTNTNIKLNIISYIKLPNIGVKLNLFIKREVCSCAVFKNSIDITYIEKHLVRLREYIEKISKLNIRYHDFIGTL
jgi:hypothetical protein